MTRASIMRLLRYLPIFNDGMILNKQGIILGKKIYYNFYYILTEIKRRNSTEDIKLVFNAI